LSPELEAEIRGRIAGLDGWADHVLDGDLAYEIDARQIPENWPTGYVPLRKATPYEEPVRKELEGEVSHSIRSLSAGISPDERCAASDSDSLRGSRARFVGFPNALKPPFVTRATRSRRAPSGTAQK